jgi:excisionase family DNA binding protein
MLSLTVSRLIINLNEITDKVCKEGSRYLIFKTGEPIFGIVPIKDLEGIGENLQDTTKECFASTVSLKEAAKILKMTLITLRKKIDQGEILTVKKLGMIRIDELELKRIQELRLLKKNSIPLNQAAKRLHVSAGIVKGYIADGSIKSIKIDNQVRIPKEEILRIENQNKLFTIEEASEFLNTKPNAILDLVHEEKIKLVHSKDGFKISKQELEDFAKPKSALVNKTQTQIVTLVTKNPEKKFDSPSTGSILSLSEAAKFLGVSNQTVKSYVQKGLLNVLYIHGSKNFDMEELKKYKKTLPQFKYKYLEKVSKLSPEELKLLENKKLFSVDEIALLLRVSRGVVEKQIHDGHIKIIRIGKRVRISNEEYRRFINKEQLLSIKEAANLINIPPSTIRQLIRQNKIHVGRKGGNRGYGISKQELARFVKESQKFDSESRL